MVRVVRHCPSCKESHTLRFSHRRGFFEKTLLSFIKMRPFRCTLCGERFRCFIFRVAAPAYREPRALRNGPQDRPALGEDSPDLQDVLSEIAQIERKLYRKRSGSEIVRAGE